MIDIADPVSKSCNVPANSKYHVPRKICINAFLMAESYYYLHYPWLKGPNNDLC